MKSHDKIVLRAFLLGMVLVMALSAFVNAAPDVRWGYRLTPQNIVFIQGGYPANWNLDAATILFSTGTESRDALLAGEIDVAELGVTPMLTSAVRAQKDLVVIGVSSFGGGKYRVVVGKDSPYKSMKELVGKKLAMRVGSGNYTAFLMWTKENGFSEKDFQIANMGDTDAMAAMQSGSVDAVVYWEPTPSILVAKGIAREIFDFEGYVYNPVYLTARREWAEQNPEAVTRLLAAWMEAQQFMTFNKKEAARLSSEALAKRGINIPTAAYELALGHEVYETWLYPDVIEETKSTFEFLKESGKIPSRAKIDWGSLFDPSYQTDAWRLLTQRYFGN